MKNKMHPQPCPILDDLEDRVKQLIEVNRIALASGNLTELEDNGLDYQNMGFQSVLVLISQIRKRGTIWRGGYIDGKGPVYSDLLQATIDMQKSRQIEDELDDDLQRHLSLE